MSDRPLPDYVIGTDPDGEREYVIRLARPRFVARVFFDADARDGEMLPESMTDNEEIGEGAGQTIEVERDGDHFEISVARWDDPPPAGEDVERLLREAAAALAIADEADARSAYAQAIEPMTPEELRACGEAIFGAQWQTALARRTGVSARQVRYWLAGTSEISAARAHVIRGWALVAERETRQRRAP